MDDIAAIWDDTDPDDVMAYTDTDLTFSRNWSTRFYDPTGEYRNKARGIQDHWELADLSETLDFATRIAVAELIDSAEAYISRDEYDVSYTIPPRGWVQTNVRGSVEYDETDTDDQYIQISIPPVCRDMVEDIIDQGLFDSKKDVIKHGIDLLVGE